MKRAINIARQSFGEIPVGAIIIHNGEIISSACNRKEKDNDVTCHAEILAIREAEQKLGNWRLDECEMYVTLEPCPMCAWAIISSRIRSDYFGSFDNNYCALGSVIDLRKLANSKLKVYSGIMQDECDKMLKEFFENKRKS